jgi:hypothetical protein
MLPEKGLDSPYLGSGSYGNDIFYSCLTVWIVQWETNWHFIMKAAGTRIKLIAMYPRPGCNDEDKFGCQMRHL